MFGVAADFAFAKKEAGKAEDGGLILTSQCGKAASQTAVTSFERKKSTFGGFNESIFLDSEADRAC